EVLCDARQVDGRWSNYARVTLPAGVSSPRAVRVGKMDAQGGPADHSEVGDLVRLRLLRFAAYGGVDAGSGPEREASVSDDGNVRVSVHYELYDGIPAMSKWITVHNGTTRDVVVNKFSAEELAVVEQVSWVESEGASIPTPQYL